MSIVSFMMRRGCKKSDVKRDAGLVYPDNVVRVEDISYGPHKMNVLDVYRPSTTQEKLPVIVSVHGGGWVYGDETHKLGHVFHLDMRNGIGKLCNDEQCAYFKEIMA